VRLRAAAALVCGILGVTNNALNLAVANGGPGTGNGVVGVAAALVLGVIAAPKRTGGGRTFG
jgi:hypothetical protein